MLGGRAHLHGERPLAGLTGQRVIGGQGGLNVGIDNQYPLSEIGQEAGQVGD